MGCVTTKQFNEYKIEMEHRITVLESLVNIEVETVLQSTVSKIDKWDSKFLNFKTSMAITRNIINKRMEALEDS